MQENTPFIVFVQFFAVLDKNIKTSGIVDSRRINIRTLFRSELTSMGLRNTERKVVDAFYQRPLGVLDLQFQPDGLVLKKSIQSLYELLCGIVGPVDTDMLFGRTLQQVSKSQAAQHHPPQQFL